MDNINFTGLKNIGFLNIYEKQPQIPFPLRRSNMIIQLTDDYNGKDLSEFKEILKKCATKEESYIFPHDSNFLHLFTAQYENSIDIPELFVNWIKVPTENKTMPLFTYIAKVTKRIASMKSKDFIVDNDFKYGPDGNEYIFPMKKLTDFIYPENIPRTLDMIYSQHSCKYGADKINNDIQTQMLDYLG